MALSDAYRRGWVLGLGATGFSRESVRRHTAKLLSFSRADSRLKPVSGGQATVALMLQRVPPAMLQIALLVAAYQMNDIAPQP
jgi:hypothetical protein